MIERHLERFLESVRHQLGVDTNTELASEVLSAAIGQAVAAWVWRRRGAPKWAARGLAGLQIQIILVRRQVHLGRLAAERHQAISRERQLRDRAAATWLRNHDAEPGEGLLQYAARMEHRRNQLIKAIRKHDSASNWDPSAVDADLYAVLDDEELKANFDRRRT